ncbi:MAG: four helix bundle protein [Candidatus Brocadiaceae bacterium]|nr:four helix bundle protein [Candidatus Brocadiaceae bacterium]
MARYEHLPIYKKALDLTIYFEEIVRHFSCYQKYTLGSELREKSREIVGLIIKANSTRERLPLLLELRDRLEGLKVLVRICKEVKAFHNFNSYEHAFTLLIELSRQNEGWMRGQKK